MHWGLVPVCCALMAAAAQDPPLDPDLIGLARIRTRMAETLARQPNYTCVQRIERSHRRLPRRRFELHDVLRIEVALVNGKEMFAWPGARSFEQTDLTEMVSGGAIGTGDFAMHARAVFQTSAPSFHYAGATELRGHKAVRFEYVVPLLGSGYHIKSAGREATVGYHGSFWADAVTHELLRLEVNADDIPPELNLTSARDVMDYGRVRIGTADFLLPLGSELAMVDLAGNENRNRTEFTACRQYTGESVLTFAEAPRDQAEAHQAMEPVKLQAAKIAGKIDLPAGTRLEVRLMTAIDSANSAIGDAVTAILVQDVKSRGRVLCAKGARLAGRILRLETHDDLATLDVQFSEIESLDGRSPVVARIEESTWPFTVPPVRSLFDPAPPAPSREAWGLHVHGDRLRLRAGSRLRLRTASLPVAQVPRIEPAR